MRWAVLSPFSNPRAGRVANRRGSSVEYEPYHCLVGTMGEVIQGY